jgi:phosphomannomutase/phosphoglucomutase
MQILGTIFRDYDIRGIAGKEFSQKALDEYEKWYGKFPGITITPEAAEAIGKAYGTIIRRKGGRKIIVGHEIRPFGEELKMSFVDGILTTGCDVDDAGESLTPIIYFSIAFYGYDGGVSVTGSHNIYFYNGFKMMGKNVFPIYGQEIQDMHGMIEREDFLVETRGLYTKKDVWGDYKKYLLDHNHLQKKLKVVVDCGNGSPGKFAPIMLSELGCETTGLFIETDATFPNHLPDPEDPWMMKDLQQKVLDVGADIGIAFDADGDRFGVVDENGKFIDADRVLMLIAKDILTRNPGKKILYDVKCTRLLEEFIPKFGGVPMIHVTGHAPIKATLRTDLDVILGGEVSGHFYHCEDYFKIDDGLYSAGKVLSLLSGSEKKFSELFTDFPQTVMTPELKLPCADDIKQKVVEEVSKTFRLLYKTIDIDGVRILFSGTSWGLVRASNTGPYLTIRVEADSEEEVVKIKNLLADQMEKYPEITDKLDRTCITSHTGKLGWV